MPKVSDCLVKTLEVLQFSRNRLSSRFINKATPFETAAGPDSTTPKRNCWGGNSKNTPKRKEKRKKEETNADNGGLTEVTRLHDHYAHQGLAPSS